jgi:hypothetical protein
MSKDNKKVPHSPHHNDSGEQLDLFADCFFEYRTCSLGSIESKYRDPKGSNNFNSHAGVMGDMSYQDENNGKPVSSEAHPGAHRFYSNNSSHHTDSNREEYTGGVTNKGSVGQISHTTAADDLSGAAKNRIALHGNEARVRSTSDGVDASDGGITVQTTDGRRHAFHEKDVIQSFGGVHYSTFQGDYGTHVQKGNMDVRVEKGKLQFNAAGDTGAFKSGKDMTIESGTKITIKVGGSSIVITDGEITIKSGSIKFEKS